MPTRYAASVALFLASALCPTPAQASVFDSATAWPADPDGYTRISVCIEDGSSTREKKSSQLPHASNPSLEDVLDQVKDALQDNWERRTSVRFVDWEPCDDLSSSERDGAVGLLIHKNGPNQSPVGTYARGDTTQFKPWGWGGTCIEWDWSDMRYEYSFDCAREYAVHEFGHALGFKHEWHHPQTPSSCGNADPFPDDGRYVFADWLNYDWDSVMTYEDDCADVSGVRFGSRSLSYIDQMGARLAYPISEQVVSFLGAHGKYFRAENNGGGGDRVKADRSRIRGHERFILTGPTDDLDCFRSGDTVSVRTYDYWYWRAGTDGELWVDRDREREHERFVLTNHSDPTGCLVGGDDISLRSAHGLWVKAHPGGDASAEAPADRSWEKLQVVVH